MQTNKFDKMFSDYYTSYAKYVILDRATPLIDDGLKPVQRRVLYSMLEMDDGKYNKVANIVGNTMKYHMHGDTSIYGALVTIANHDLLIDKQGNFGNKYTGDDAAAARYIEARLNPFAKEILYNKNVTKFKRSYDDRNDEPMFLPLKFPLMLAQGVEGIGVSLTSKILPHNPKELLEACISILEGNNFEIYPDFYTKGSVDISDYRNGEKGGKVKIRGTVSKLSKNSLVITEIPYGETTESIINSIVSAVDKDKIKLKKVEDNTTRDVNIVVHANAGADLDKLIDALYAFTSLQKSITTTCTVIKDGKPCFTNVKDVLIHNVNTIQNVIKDEIDYEMAVLNNKIWALMCEVMFVSTDAHELIKSTQDKNEMITKLITRLNELFQKLIKKGGDLVPYIRTVNEDDVKKLISMPMYKMASYEVGVIKENIESLKNQFIELSEKKTNIKRTTINWFKYLIKKYGKNWDRKTVITTFDRVDVSKVANTNMKLYIDYDNGFVGTSMKKDTYVCDVADTDDFVVFTKDGNMIVKKVCDKTFVSDNIILANRFAKSDDSIYTIVYKMEGEEKTMIKRFKIGGITRDKVNPVCDSDYKCEIIYISCSKESEKLDVILEEKPRLKVKQLEYDTSIVSVSGRNSIGRMFTKTPIKSVKKI